MKVLKSKNVWIMIGVLAFAIWFLIMGFKLPVYDSVFVSPAAVNTVFCSILIVLGLIGLVFYIREALKSEPAAEEKSVEKVNIFKRLFSKENDNFYLTMAIIMVAVYLIVLIPLLHFYIATAIFVFACCCVFMPKMNKLIGLAIAAGTLGFLYVLFVLLFRVTIRI